MLYLVRLFTFSLIVFIASCASAPEFCHVGTEGIVLADSSSIAANVSAHLDELAPIVKNYLGSSKATPISILVVNRDTRGAYISGEHSRIEIRRDIATEQQKRFILYHELVHWYGDGTWIDSLPLYVEEGVADYLSCERIGALEARSTEKALAPGTTLDLNWLHTVTPHEWQKADAAQTEFMRRAGFAVVYRIGIPRLREAASLGPLKPADIQRLLTESVGESQTPL